MMYPEETNRVVRNIYKYFFASFMPLTPHVVMGDYTLCPTSNTQIGKRTFQSSV